MSKRLAILQFGNADGSLAPMDYASLQLERVELCAEGKDLDPREHESRAIDIARSLPSGSTLVFNAEHYGPKNVEIASSLISTTRKIAPTLRTSAYIPEITLPFWDSIGNGGDSRRASVKTARFAAESLRRAGASFLSLDGYAFLGSRGTPVTDWASSSWLETWKIAKGEAGALVESVLPVAVWISNRVHSNGVEIPVGQIEPTVGIDEWAKMIVFLEAKGWTTISLLGWSQVLKSRTGRGFAPLSSEDESALAALKSIQIAR